MFGVFFVWWLEDGTHLRPQVPPTHRWQPSVHFFYGCWMLGTLEGFSRWVFQKLCQHWDEVFFFQGWLEQWHGHYQKTKRWNFTPEVVITTAPRCRETSPRRFLPKPLACGPRLGGKEWPGKAGTERKKRSSPKRETKDGGYHFSGANWLFFFVFGGGAHGIYKKRISMKSWKMFSKVNG